jgi:ABC-type multidrug transport system fused ATPase/permease subunit
VSGHSGRALFLWLWRGYLRPHGGWLALAMLFMAAEGASLGLFASRMEPMFDDVFVEPRPGAIWTVGLSIAGIFVLRALASATHKVLLTRVNEMTAASLQRDLLAHLMTLDTPFHQSHPPGVLIERVQGDVQAIKTAWTGPGSSPGSGGTRSRWRRSWRWRSRWTGAGLWWRWWGCRC